MLQVEASFLHISLPGDIFNRMNPLKKIETLTCFDTCVHSVNIQNSKKKSMWRAVQCGVLFLRAGEMQTQDFPYHLEEEKEKLLLIMNWKKNYKVSFLTIFTVWIYGNMYIWQSKLFTIGQEKFSKHFLKMLIILILTRYLSFVLLTLMKTPKTKIQKTHTVSSDKLFSGKKEILSTVTVVKHHKNKAKICRFVWYRC